MMTVLLAAAGLTDDVLYLLGFFWWVVLALGVGAVA
jgi:hypothetical protein